MTWTRVALLTVLVLFLGAAAARATLLIRSDGNGLFVMDQNHLHDRVAIFSGSSEGRTAYVVRNANLVDNFKFDRQFGCRIRDGDSAFCDRNGPIFNVQLAGGNDDIIMTEAPIGESSVAGGLGNDEMDGHAGRDHLHGQSGEDLLRAHGGNDELFGGDNSDRLEGGIGNDTLEGENGADVLIGGLGADILRGNPGNDFIDAKEPSGVGVADEIGCGGDFDTLEADLKDVIPASCEQVNQSPVGETPHVKILAKTLRVSPSGAVSVRLGCPREVKELGCNGSLQLRIARTGKRSVRYTIRADNRKTVTVKLTSKDVRTLRGRQRRGKRTRGILASVEKGRLGPKTTIRNPRLKLR